MCDPSSSFFKIQTKNITHSNYNSKKASLFLGKVWHYPLIVAQAHPLGGSLLQHCWPVSQFANVDDENEPLDANSVDP